MTKKQLKKIKKNVWIVIPAYNEEKHIRAVIRGLKQHGWKNIIVVNDGSSDRTPEIAEQEGAIVLTHIINRNLGAALKTGITYALMKGADYIITFDGDGQHFPEDVIKLVKALEQGKGDIIIGSRFLSKKYSKNVPLKYKIGNILLNIYTAILSFRWVTDTQSGLRGFTREAAKKITLTINNFAVSSEIILEAAHKHLRIAEVPINIRYPHKRQGFKTGLKILYRLMLKVLRI